MKPSLCIPRFRTNAAACSRKSRHVSQMSLLERLREAVFRLIMLSALSKAPPVQRSDSSNANAAGVYHRAGANYYHPPEPHHSDAVADCIEFIKKSATAEDGRHSTASSTSSSSHEVIFSAPVL